MRQPIQIVTAAVEDEDSTLALVGPDEQSVIAQILDNYDPEGRFAALSEVSEQLQRVMDTQGLVVNIETHVIDAAAYSAAPPADDTQTARTEGAPSQPGMFTVTCRIDLEADTAEAAAREALTIHRDPDSIAVVFEVTEPTTGEQRTVDLLHTAQEDL